MISTVPGILKTRRLRERAVNLDSESLFKRLNSLIERLLVGFLDFWKDQVRPCNKTMCSSCDGVLEYTCKLE